MKEKYPGIMILGLSTFNQGLYIKKMMENGASGYILKNASGEELLNNTLKHAAASEALVQLIKEEKRLSIVVEDNGKGFDPSILETSKGAGWTSIRSRVNYLQGRMDLNSEAGKGTTITIEINL